MPRAHQGGTRVGMEKHPSVVCCSFLESVDNVPFTFLAWIGEDEARGKEGGGADS